MILDMSKCSKNDVKSPISLIFRGPQTPHITTIFEKNLQTILFYVNKSACHILGTICDTSKFTKDYLVFMSSYHCLNFSGQKNVQNVSVQLIIFEIKPK